MASFVGASDYPIDTATVTPTLPVGVQAGDLMVAVFHSRMGATAVPSYSGWADDADFSDGLSPGATLAIRSKIAGASEPNPTFAYNSSARGYGVQVLVFRDASQTVNPTAVQGSSAAAQSHTPAAFGGTTPAEITWTTAAGAFSFMIGYGGEVLVESIMLNANRPSIAEGANPDAYQDTTIGSTTGGSDWAWYVAYLLVAPSPPTPPAGSRLVYPSPTTHRLTRRPGTSV